MTRDEYIDKYKSLAVDTTRGTGLFPSVMLAQAIVESKNGESGLTKDYNNHFGIKATPSWKGKSVNMMTKEVFGNKPEMQGAFFRAYDNAKQSYEDRVKFLTENKRYQNAGVFTAKTPLEQLQALQKAGYATDPEYATIINSVLIKKNLSVLDKSIALAKQHPFLTISVTVALVVSGYILYTQLTKTK